LAPGTNSYAAAFDLVEWARAKTRSEEEWTEKINSHRDALSKMKVPLSLAALEKFDTDD
jgi:hypothetical protein